MKPFSKGFGLGCLVSLGLSVVLPLFIGIIVAICSAGSEGTIAKDSVLEIDLNGSFAEVTESSPLDFLQGNTKKSLSLYDFDKALKKAADDKRIKGAYIKVGGLTCSPATRQQLRRSLQEFKESGKWVIAYADNYEQGDYYVCSVADSLFINPYGMLDWHGMAAQPFFLADLMEKVGVECQVVKVGRYKSAPEMFTANHMSDDNRHQTEVYINSIWDAILDDVAEARNIPQDSLRAYASRQIVFSATPEEYIKLGFIDGIAYENEMTAIVRQRLALDEDAKVPTTDLASMLPKTPAKVSGKRIVVYTAIGDIVDASSSTSSDNEIVGGVVCADLDALAKDDKVQAVVLRVNSGGGSAYASEQMWHSVERLKAAGKPVVVSMGDMAASGGYYISCGADKIFAERTTITGSIGIFGLIPCANKLVEGKLGVHFENIETNPGAAPPMSLMQPLTQGTREAMQKYIERGYDTFLTRVATGRGMSKEDVHEIAQGRVWTGADALGIGLVDSIGGLADAIACAADMAEIEGEPAVDYQPASKEWWESLAEMDKPKRLLPDAMIPAELRQPLKTMLNAERMQGAQARLPFVLNLK